jgi:hypothetical protein
LALDRDERSASCPYSFTLGEITRGVNCIEHWAIPCLRNFWTFPNLCNVFHFIFFIQTAEAFTSVTCGRYFLFRRILKGDACAETWEDIKQFWNSILS